MEKYHRHNVALHLAFVHNNVLYADCEFTMCPLVSRPLKVPIRCCAEQYIDGWLAGWRLSRTLNGRFALCDQRFSWFMVNADASESIDFGNYTILLAWDQYHISQISAENVALTSSTTQTHTHADIIFSSSRHYSKYRRNENGLVRRKSWTHAKMY